jgi:hypothetical protein
MLANLRALFGVIVDIVLLRRGPETLPASSTLLGIVVTVYTVLNGLAYHAFILAALPVRPRYFDLQFVVTVALQLLWFRVAFRMAGKPERFLQTATAVFATSTLFIPMLALVGALMPYMKKDSTVEPPALPSFLTAFAAIWMLMILVHIVRSAFEWSWLRSLGFVLAANFVPAILASILFGVAQPPV